MLEDITCVFEGVSGVGAIFISNLKAAQNIRLLNYHRIKAIVSVVRGGIVEHSKSQIHDQLYIPAQDVQSYDLQKYFEETYKFIDNARKNTNVLVHCFAGISRSATIVIAYLLKKFNYPLEKVIELVKRKRTKINPNKGFLQQLKRLANKIGVKSAQSEINLDLLLKRPHSTERNRKVLTSPCLKSLRENPFTFQNSDPPAGSQTSKAVGSTQLLQGSHKQLSSMKVISQKENGEKGEQNKAKDCEMREISLFNENYSLKTLNNKSNILRVDKEQKIQNLKSKVLASENRKKSMRKMEESNQLKSKTNPQPFKNSAYCFNNETIKNHHSKVLFDPSTSIKGGKTLLTSNYLKVQKERRDNQCQI